MSTRICIKCGVEKPLTVEFFRRNAAYITGRYRYKCRTCEFEEIVKDHQDINGNLKCLVCGEYKNEVEFSLTKNNRHRKGRDRRCSMCRTKESRERRKLLADNPQITRIIKERFLGARDRAKKKRIDFNITEEYILELLYKQDNRCAITGDELTFILGNGRTPTNLSIDRIDPNLGYTKGNVQLVCMAVNQFKNDLSSKEFLNLCRKVVEHNDKD